MDSSNLLSDPAFTPQDWQYLQSFHNALDELTLETCDRCNECWFDMGIGQEGVCARCLWADEDQETFLYGIENRMDPGCLPDLPELTQVEEMLIARVHVLIEVRQVRGQQYKYKGHVRMSYQGPSC